MKIDCSKFKTALTLKREYTLIEQGYELNTSREYEMKQSTLLNLNTSNIITNHINQNKPFFCDIETHGLYLEICLVQIYQAHWNYPLIIPYPNVEALKKFVNAVHTVWYNASYDLGTIGVSPNSYDDLFYAAKTAYPGLDSYSLDSVEQHLGIPWHDWVKYIKSHLGVTYPKKINGKLQSFNKKEMQKSFASAKCKKSRAFTQAQLKYAAADCYGLVDMWEDRKIQRVIKENKAYKIDIQAQKDALIYQYNGMHVYQDRKNRAMRKAQRFLNYYKNQLPEDLNTNSPKQLKEYFTQRNIKLPLDHQTGKPSTGEASLKKLYIQENIKEAEYILKAKKASKQLSTLNIYSQGDKIKTFFNAAGAITGRFQSTGGDREGYTNIQQIPRNLKKIFGYSESSDRIIVNADYGTAELIAGCAIFKVPTMRDEILNGLDLHKATATWLAGVKYEDVTKTQRQNAKAVNFGFLFGMGIDLFITYAYDTYGVKFTHKEAEKAKALYYKTHPGIYEYHQYIGKMTRKTDFTLKTALGRVAGGLRYTDALNIPVQGSIAEATKIAIHHFITHNKKLISAGNIIINMVHDSIVGDIHKKYIEEWQYNIRKSMQYGWQEVSKSDIFHYKNLPMGVDVEFSHEYGGEYNKEKIQKLISSYKIT